MAVGKGRNSNHNKRAIFFIPVDESADPGAGGRGIEGQSKISKVIWFSVAATHK